MAFPNILTRQTNYAKFNCDRSREASRLNVKINFCENISMPSQKITIKDIAKKAHVSYQTVSRVINNRPDVSEETRTRIWEIIDELGYRPSAAARSLRTNMTYTLGMLQNDITNSFYSNIVKGVEEVAIQHGYSLILCNINDDAERELHYLRILQSKQVDGIILGPIMPNSDFIVKLSEQIPIVLVDREIPDSDITAVIVDNQKASCGAVDYLIDHGHRHIGLITRSFDDFPTMRSRQAGYESALQNAGIPLDPAHIIQIPKVPTETIAELVEQFIKDNPTLTAIFASNNQLGLGVLMALHKLNMKIPQDMALVIFDDLPLFSLHTPPITVVKQPETDIGKHAIAHLLRQISQRTDYVPETIVLNTEFIIRESV